MNKKRTIAACFSNPADRKLASDYLSSLSYDLVDFQEEGGAQADLFILDVPSARRIGRQVLALKKAADVLLPMIVALGKDDPIDPWLTAGFDDCMQEPFTKTQLKAKVAMLLRVRQQAEELARRSEARYQAIFEAIGTATLIVEEDTTIIMANKECPRVMGYSPEELIGTKWINYIPPESLEIMLKYHKARREDSEKAPNQYEAKLVNKAGQVRDVLLSIGMVPGTKQSIASLLDITESKRAEEERATLALRNEALVKSFGEIVYDWRPLEDKLIWDGNFTQVLGYTPDEMGSNTEGWTSRVHPDDLQRVLDEVERATQERRLFDLEYRFKRNDGNYCWMHDQGVTYVDERGTLNRIIGVFSDITEHKRATEALRESESRYRALAEAAHDMIFVIDRDDRVQYANTFAARQFGATPEQLIGKPRAELFPPDIAGRQGQSLRRVFDNGQPLFNETTIRFAKREMWISNWLVPLRDESGAVTAVLGISRDITEQRRLEEQYLQAQKMEAIGRLAGGVAHDFNNMLNVIIGYGEIVFDKLHHGDPLRKEVEEIIKAGQRSAALTRQLLAFSRKQPLQPEVLDLNALLKNLEKMLRRLIGENIDLELTLAADLAHVKADPAQVEQVIMNLAVNAQDAMPHGGKLTIETANVEFDDLYAQNYAEVMAGIYVMIAITDTGCGMDKETISKVFDPFFTTKDKGKGTGLGLAMVYGIVKQSGGNICVSSEQGQGTTFKIYLPRTDAEPDLKEVRPAEGERWGGSGHILVVEDEEALRDLLETVLTELGYQVTLAANGGEALLQVEEKGLEPDLVITDVVMPGMSGVVLAECLQRNRPDLKVLYMSGYTDNALTHHGALDPALPFIQKPFNIKDLAAKIKQVMLGQKQNHPADHRQPH